MLVVKCMLFVVQALAYAHACIRECVRAAVRACVCLCLCLFAVGVDVGDIILLFVVLE